MPVGNALNTNARRERNGKRKKIDDKSILFHFHFFTDGPDRFIGDGG